MTIRNMRHDRRRRDVPRGLLFAFAIAVAIGGLLPGDSVATNFGSSYDDPCDEDRKAQCVANNKFHTVFVNVTGDYADAIYLAMDHYSSVASPLSVYDAPDPYEDKDVEVRTLSDPDYEALAWTRCAYPPGDSRMQYGGSNANHTRWCRPQRIVFNTAFEASYYPGDTKKHYIACHELGHSVGLRHRNNGEGSSSTCMVSATIDPHYVPTFTTTSGHDRNEIDDFYD